MDENFEKLQKVFSSLLVSSEYPEDHLTNFLLKIEKRIEKFYEFFDNEVNNYEDFDTNLLSEDFEFKEIKNYLNERIIRISTHLLNKFSYRETNQLFDIKVIDVLENIIRIHTFLSQDI